MLSDVYVYVLLAFTCCLLDSYTYSILQLVFMYVYAHALRK